MSSFGPPPFRAGGPAHCTVANGRHRVGHTGAVRVRFYAIYVERRLKHPAVVAICETARQKLFGPAR
jgi:hypothetical protein